MIQNPKNSALESFIYPIVWAILGKRMAETTYFKDKIYLPRKVREKLGLVNGDRLLIEVTERGDVKLIATRAAEASKRILRRLNNPPDMGRLKRVAREQIYENVA
jgi:bifunctional DNA-binding transcriptional regulator/antitoxin component of YhaV-PrlF toxin-antitoxin module